MTHPLLSRWQQTTEFLRLAYATKYVVGADAPVSVMLIGEPGDGKSTLLSRFGTAPGVHVSDNFTQTSLYPILERAKAGEVKTLIISDFGTLVNKRASVSDPAIALLAAATSDGVRRVELGDARRVHFGGATLSVFTAMNQHDYNRYRLSTLATNAFLTRFFLVDFSLTDSESKFMLRMKYKGDRSLLLPVTFRKGGIKDTRVSIARKHSERALLMFEEMRNRSPFGVVAGMRTADAFRCLMQASALLSGRKRVLDIDVKRLQGLAEVWRGREAHGVKRNAKVKAKPRKFKKVKTGRPYKGHERKKK